MVEQLTLNWGHVADSSGRPRTNSQLTLSQLTESLCAYMCLHIDCSLLRSESYAAQMPPFMWL
jgi:hypothetical protein